MPSMPNGAITRLQFDTARDQFTARFLIDANKLPKVPLQTFDFADLKTLVDGVEGDYRLVVVHYGLKDDSLCYGFSFTVGTPIPDTDSYTYPEQKEPTHVLVGKHFQPITAAAWAPMRSAYLDTMWTKRDNGHFEQLTAVDALRCVFPWEAELQPLYEDNAGNGEYRMAVESISRHHDAENGDGGATSLKGFRHEIGFYMEELVEGKWVRLLSDAVENAPYRNRAADFGNLCPVKCSTYTEV
ncbi:MAG: hypothetical protein R2811_14190 [Flavobacteriales bacterium]